MPPAKRLSTREWRRLAFGPFCVYSIVASAEGPPQTRHFERFTEELSGGATQFPPGRVRTALESVVSNPDALFATFVADGGPPRDGLRAVVGTLKKCEPVERDLYLDWLVALAIAIASATRTIPGPLISPAEREAVADVAQLLGQPVPAFPEVDD